MRDEAPARLWIAGAGSNKNSNNAGSGKEKENVVRFGVSSALSFAGALFAGAAVASEPTCPAGLYANATEIAVLYERPDENGETETRYMFTDGRFGPIDAEASPLRCEAGAVRSIVTGEMARRPLNETDAKFNSDGLQLAGRLVEPYGGAPDAPLVVFVHGSESTPTVGYSPYPYILAAQGVSVFAFDKRGTGASEGEYTQDFHALAGDVVAAAETARELAKGRFGRFGLFGGSQGGWIAPLAANEAEADFVAVGFGLVLSPLEENAEQVFDEMRRAGYDDEAIEEARVLVDATGEVVATYFSPESVAHLKKAKAAYANEPWYSEIEGEFTGPILRASDADLAAGKVEGFSDHEVPWRHDAVSVLRELSMPQLWVIAAEDTVAPGTLTRERLAALQADGFPVTTAVFPDTDHGMAEFVEEADGPRRRTRITDGYFRLLADYMKGTLSPPYARGLITPPVAEAQPAD